MALTGFSSEFFAFIVPLSVAVVFELKFYIKFGFKLSKVFMQVFWANVPPFEV